MMNKSLSQNVVQNPTVTATQKRALRDISNSLVPSASSDVTQQDSNKRVTGKTRKNRDAISSDELTRLFSDVAATPTSSTSGLSQTVQATAEFQSINLSGKELSFNAHSSTHKDGCSRFEFRHIPDIDVMHAHDPLFCSEYAKEIYFNWRKKESKLEPFAGYLDFQSNINEKMRLVLLNWLVDVHQKFRMDTETLYLTINVIDRFLGKKAVKRQKLQLVGISAMLIASKYQDMHAPRVHDFVNITDNAYCADDVVRMEALILDAISFDLTVPSPLCFVMRFLRAANADCRQSNLSNYCLEVAMLNYSMLKYSPSLMAASAVYLGQYLDGKHEIWTEALQYYTEYSFEDICQCVNQMKHTLRLDQSNTNQKLTALKRKYSHSKYLKVAESIFN